MGGTDVIEFDGNEVTICLKEGQERRQEMIDTDVITESRRMD